MRIQQSSQQKIKAAIYLAIAVSVFVAACLTLAVMTKSGSFGGETGCYFALCFFTVPAIVYQIMVPMWSRAWRFNNLYAFAVIDLLYALLWFASSIAVAVWNARGISKGKDEDDANTRRDDDDDDAGDNESDGTCASFAYGSASKCAVSKASVGLGIIIFLLFCTTSYFSIRALAEYRKTGSLPNAAFGKNRGDADAQTGEDLTKDPWPTNTDDLNSSDRLPYDGHIEDDQAGLLNGTRHSLDPDVQQPADGMARPERRIDYELSTQRPPPYDVSYAPRALSPGLPTVGFPEADYNALR